MSMCFGCDRFERSEILLHDRDLSTALDPIMTDAIASTKQQESDLAKVLAIA